MFISSTKSCMKTLCVVVSSLLLVAQFSHNPLGPTANMWITDAVMYCSWTLSVYLSFWKREVSSSSDECTRQALISVLVLCLILLYCSHLNFMHLQGTKWSVLNNQCFKLGMWLCSYLYAVLCFFFFTSDSCTVNCGKERLNHRVQDEYNHEVIIQVTYKSIKLRRSGMKTSLL